MLFNKYIKKQLLYFIYIYISFLAFLTFVRQMLFIHKEEKLYDNYL